MRGKNTPHSKAISDFTTMKSVLRNQCEIIKTCILNLLKWQESQSVTFIFASHIYFVLLALLF